MRNNCAISAFLLSLAWLCVPSYAADVGLQGRAFIENHKVMKMPLEWETQDVSYEKDLKDADLVVSFGQQTYPILREEVEKYAQAHGLKIVVQSGTCGISAGKLLRKTVDSGAFCCPPGDTDRLPGLEFHTIGISAIAVIVNAKNPVNNLSTAEARDIFRGKLRHWEDLNPVQSLSEPIATNARLHCKARPGHWTLLLKKQEFFSPNLKEVGVIPDLIAKVGQELNAISIETPFMVNTYSKPGTVKMVMLNGHAATDTQYIAAGNYPFYRTYNLTTWQRPGKKHEDTAKLIAHLRNFIEENHQRYGMIPVSMLKAAGWKFKNDELVGEPDGKSLAHYPPVN